MTMYVLSFYSNGELANLIDGVYGVFDSMERAFSAVGHHCEAFGLTVYDYDCDLTLWRFFTDKGTYVVESMELNDEGCI